MRENRRYRPKKSLETCRTHPGREPQPEDNRYDALRAAVPPKPLKKRWSGRLSTPSWIRRA